MKKQLLVLSMSAGFLTVGAQEAPFAPEANKHHVGPAVFVDDNSDVNAPEASVQRAAPFWSENFSGGAIPAGWTNVDSGTPATGDPVTFVWSNNAADVAAAALGYMPSSNFDAAGASDGYLWANSDRGLAAAPPTIHQAELTTGAIDCSMQPTVLLTFESLIGVFDSAASTNALVRVSTDLVNWDSYQAFPCLETGAAAPPCVRWSANPEFVEIDISASAGGQSTVYVQFFWEGGWEYFWALDNIELSPVPDYERELIFSLVEHAGDGFEYGRVPESQLNADINIGLYGRTFGTTAQTNVVLQGEVFDAGGASIITSSANFASVAQYDTASFENLEPTSSLAAGLYSADFTWSSDQDSLETDPNDDLIQRQFEITPSSGPSAVYGLDGIGVYTNPSTTTIGTGSFTDGADGLKILAFMRIVNDITFTGAEAIIDPATVPGGEVTFSVHNFADVDAGDVFTTLAETPTIPVSQWQVDDGKISGEFSNPAMLTAGDYYVAITMNSFGNSSDITVVDDATVPQPGAAGLIYIAGGATPGVFGNGNAPAVRLSMDASVGINDNVEVADFTVSPNPSNGLIRIDTPEEGQLSVQITNMLGELVVTETFSTTTTLDLSMYAKGMYTVRVANGNVAKTQLVSIK